MDCGPTCIRMIAKDYGKHYSIQYLRERTSIGRNGVSLQGMSECAENIGFRSIPVNVSMKRLIEEVPLPCVAYWDTQHYVVIYKVKKGKNDEGFVRIADPSRGKQKLDFKEFRKRWLNKNTELGILLLLEPTPSFFSKGSEKKQKYGFGQILRQLWVYRRLLLQLLLGLMVGSLLQLILPFLAQSVIDVGVNTRNISFLQLILIAQIVISVSRVSVEFVRSWILLNISMRLNLTILSDFIYKMLKLPLSFFDTKRFGDVLQRVNDHSRIESFLTSQTLGFLFSVLNIFVFSFVLAIYSWKFLAAFFVGTVIYGAWILLFLKKRRSLDFQQFDLTSQSHSKLVQLLQGIQEIKLAGASRELRWSWESTRVGLFKVQAKSLALFQYQQAGGFIVNESKNLFITYISALLVINGEISLGAMLAIQYIIGQMSSPVEQLLDFIRQFQDAKISLERMSEVHELSDEETHEQIPIETNSTDLTNIQLNDVSFSYPGNSENIVLDKFSLTIPKGKTTAIVGESGSGKTTLIKLLLQIYLPSNGEILIGNSNLKKYKPSSWRKLCGVVLQDGFILSASLADNIALGNNGHIDYVQLDFAIKTANLTDMVESLPSGYHTTIGDEGQGLSQGQKQRILIARAIYKSPQYIFFDEATNSLDSTNERKIMENLKSFFCNKTVVIVAHRLSTVKDADQIIVLDRGKIVEKGTHKELVLSRGKYYTLVKNQLELGNE